MQDIAKNKAFVEDLQRTVQAQSRPVLARRLSTACTLIYAALKKTKGNTDGTTLVDAAKGMKWESPRGPMSIDPETRDVIQTIYIRKVEKVNGELMNVDFDKVENVKDPVKAAMKNKK